MTNKNYTQLMDLHSKYAESKGLRILFFPCNQFGGQEPWPEDKIKEFVTSKFGTGPDLFSKVNVNGSDAHPLFNFLKMKLKGTLGDFVKWNFTKFMIDNNGVPVVRYAPNTEPVDLEKDFAKYW